MPVIKRENLRLEIDETAKKFNDSRSGILPVLEMLQEKYGQISDIMMQETAERFDVRPSEVYSVVSFYSFLSEKPKGKFVIRLCQTISCDIQGKKRVARQLENELGIKFGETTSDGMFSLEYTNCLGMCDQGPALMVNNKIYTRVTPANVPEIIHECRKNFNGLNHEMDAISSNVMKAGPLLNAANKPHDALKKALSLSRVDLIGLIRESGLKGRGGAGFPTAIKWQLAAAAKGEKKFVVCNADEGEPGTFKDRLLLMEYPDLLFDGMTIAGYAIGAEHGVVYLRAEYSFLKKLMKDTLERRRKDGLLGKNVLGKEGFNFDIDLHMGAGAYVCGEETALIESLEGKRGEPRDRPPFPVVVGFDGCPTAVNNVETFVDAALIVENGAEWFSSKGTEKTTGTKLMSISGDCSKPGIYEFPMGVTIKDMLAEVGGENAKAVQVGGASGMTVPRSMFDRKITYEDVATGGSIIVFGPQTDMLDVAENFMEFFAEESCGQCFLCRMGNEKILKGIKKLKEGRLSVKELNDLENLGRSMQKGSKCGLGQTSANAFLSIVEHFSDEILGRVPCGI